MSTGAYPDPYTLVMPKTLRVPVIFASPHSGANYPESFKEASKLDPVSLRRSEDAFVDELYDQCVAFGAPMIKSNYPRAFVDLNREPFELDPQMFDGRLPKYVTTQSARVSAGLGTVAKVVTNGNEIYNRKLSFEEVRARIEGIYHPYHNALKDLIDQSLDQFGCCLLVDCHSMPSIGGPMDDDQGSNRTDIVLGDRFGTSCAGWITDLAQLRLQQENFVVRRNRPYAGGFTTDNYGQPEKNVHALQIELNRVLYMNEVSVTRLKSLGEVKQRLLPLVKSLCEIDPSAFK